MIKNGILDLLKAATGELKIPNNLVDLSVSADKKFGDFSSNVALQWAKNDSNTDKQSPEEIANKILEKLPPSDFVEKLSVTPPGFINFTVKDAAWQKTVDQILKESGQFGSSKIGSGKKARVEFVSANPTGPLHFGNARGGPIGDTLSSVLEFVGYDVLREYYHNDVGVQVTKLGQSIINVRAGESLEDQEYKGQYVKDLASQILNSKFKIQNSKLKEAELIEEVGKTAVDLIFEEVKADCEAMGIKFDEYFAESSFINEGKTQAALEKLEAKGSLKKNDGATWFAPRLGSGQASEFLEDRECVVTKSDGDYTYFANDIAYHDLKFASDPDLVVDIFGSNHHGHAPRLRAAVAALGYNPEKFHTILYQWVRFKKGNEILKMSKRSGSFITAREVLEEVGADALRFFILMHDASTHIDFDLDLAKKKSSDNPVYYVQYAHARIASILAKADKIDSKANLALLTSEYELDLIKHLASFPELISEVAQSFSVSHLARYAVETADLFHKFYENCPVLGQDKDLTQARIALITATKQVIENNLRLLGVSAPDKM